MESSSPNLIVKSNAVLNTEELEITIVMPCLNEAETVADCVRIARGWMVRAGVNGEVLVADNGSADGSIELAQNAGARVVNVPVRGYGSAILGGIAAAKSKYIIMGDSDGNHDLANLDDFLAKLREGYEYVIGNRYAGGFAPGSISPANQHIGNPALSWVARLFYPSRITDFLCGLRGLNREAIQKLHFRTCGVDFSMEMGVLAVLNHLRIAEVPTRQLVSGRSRKPHTNPIRDGWGVLKFLLLNSPRWLFFQPGLLLMALAAAGGLLLGQNTRALAACALLGIMGTQIALSGLFATAQMMRDQIMPPAPLWQKFRAWFSLERGALLGMVIIALGLPGIVFGLTQPAEAALRCLLASGAAAVLGAQITIASFVLGALGVKKAK